MSRIVRSNIGYPQALDTNQIHELCAYISQQESRRDLTAKSCVRKEDGQYVVHWWDGTLEYRSVEQLKSNPIRVGKAVPTEKIYLGFLKTTGAKNPAEMELYAEKNGNKYHVIGIFADGRRYDTVLCETSVEEIIIAACETFFTDGWELKLSNLAKAMLRSPC